MSADKHKCDGYDCDHCWNREVVSGDDNEWKEVAVRKLAAVTLIVLGMVGLHQNVEFSGWVLAVGIFLII